jgi:hypothetical protein
VSGWIAQFTKALATRDCKAIRVTAPYSQCSILTVLHGAHAVASKSFGSGAVVDMAGAHYPKQATDKAQLVLVQGPRGGWIEVLDLPDSPPEVGTKPPASLKPFESAAAAWIAAVVKGDCKTAFKLGAANETPRVYCTKLVSPGAVIRRVLVANRSAKPVPIGGTANVQFLRYTLKVPKSVNPRGTTTYATLPVVHVSKRALTQGATNPYLVYEPNPAPTPPAVRKGPAG